MSNISQNMAPTISIGMPVYNGEKYIRMAIASLISQTYTHFELLISDNNSQDSTEHICREYEQLDSRVKYFRQASNIGATANFKFVLEQAQGDYFMWAACDDIWSSNWLESLYKESLMSNAKMIFGSVSHINENGQPINHPANNLQYYYSGPKVYRKLSFYLSPEFLGKANTICSLYHISLRPHMMTFLDFYLFSKAKYDYMFIYNLLNYTSIESVKDAYIFKRIHNQSEGNGIIHPEESKLSLKSAYRKFCLVFNPLPNLVQDYYNNSRSIERLLLVLTLPLKTIITIIYKIIYHPRNTN